MMRRRAFLLAFIAATLLGFAFMVASPLMANPDEPAHAVKAAGTYQGELLGTETIVRQADPAVVNGTWTSLTVPAAYASLADVPACFAFHADVSGACSPPVGTDVSPATGTTYVGRYPPAYYLAVGWPTAVTSPWRALWLMRALTVVICAGLLAVAAAALAEHQAGASERPGWAGGAWIGLGLAATPTVMWLASSINPNAVEIAAAIATWVALLGVADARIALRPRSLARAAAVASVLVVSRPLAPVFFLAILAFSWIAVGSRARAAELAATRAARVAAGVVGVVVVLSFAWIVAVKANDAYMGYPTTLEGAEVVRRTIALFPEEGRQMVGVFGWLDAPLPMVAVYAWGGAVAGLVVAALVRATGRERLTLGLVLAALFVLPIITNLTAARTVGVNWVGRYSLPLAVGIPILAGLVVQRLTVPRRAACVVAGGAIVVVVGVQAIALATLLQRYVVGDQAGFWAFLGNASGWQPPIGVNGATALALVALAAVAVVLRLAIWPHRSGAGSPQRRPG